MRASILIVESETSVRCLLELGLARAGYAVQSARSEDHALQICRYGSVDLMLADVGWPPTGHDLARTVAMQCPRIKVVLMAAWHSDCENCPYLSRCPIIAKPFYMQTVIAKIAETLAAPAIELGGAS